MIDINAEIIPSKSLGGINLGDHIGSYEHFLKGMFLNIFRMLFFQ